MQVYPTILFLVWGLEYVITKVNFMIMYFILFRLRNKPVYTILYLKPMCNIFWFSSVVRKKCIVELQLSASL